MMDKGTFFNHCDRLRADGYNLMIFKDAFQSQIILRGIGKSKKGKTVYQRTALEDMHRLSSETGKDRDARVAEHIKLYNSWLLEWSENIPSGSMAQRSAFAQTQPYASPTKKAAAGTDTQPTLKPDEKSSGASVEADAQSTKTDLYRLIDKPLFFRLCRGMWDEGFTGCWKIRFDRDRFVLELIGQSLQDTNHKSLTLEYFTSDIQPAFVIMKKAMYQSWLDEWTHSILKEAIETIAPLPKQEIPESSDKEAKKITFFKMCDALWQNGFSHMQLVVSDLSFSLVGKNQSGQEDSCYLSHTCAYTGTSSQDWDNYLVSERTVYEDWLGEWCFDKVGDAGKLSELFKPEVVSVPVEETEKPGKQYTEQQLKDTVVLLGKIYSEITDAEQRLAALNTRADTLKAQLLQLLLRIDKEL